jgi:hypothetical protein
MSNVAEAPPPPKQRQRHHACGLYIRWPNKGRKYQVRWWLGEHATINLGLYPTEWLAEKVRSAILKKVRAEHLTPLGMWGLARDVLEDMRGRGFTGLPDLLPKWVRRRPDGALFAKVKKGGRIIVLDGPFDTPEAAHLAMAGVLAREFPPPVRPVNRQGRRREASRRSRAA